MCRWCIGPGRDWRPRPGGGEEHERQHGCRGIGRHSLQAVAAISWQYETRAVEAHVVRGHAERGREARVRRARGDTAGARVDVREDKITGDHLIGLECTRVFDIRILSVLHSITEYLILIPDSVGA